MKIAYLQEILSRIELRNDDIFAIVDPRKRNVKFSTDPDVRIVGKELKRE